MFFTVKFRLGEKPDKSYDVGGVKAENKEQAITIARGTMARHLSMNSLCGECETSVSDRLEAYSVS